MDVKVKGSSLRTEPFVLDATGIFGSLLFLKLFMPNCDEVRGWLGATEGPFKFSELALLNVF